MEKCCQTLLPHDGDDGDDDDRNGGNENLCQCVISGSRRPCRRRSVAMCVGKMKFTYVVTFAFCSRINFSCKMNLLCSMFNRHVISALIMDFSSKMQIFFETDRLILY